MAKPRTPARGRKTPRRSRGRAFLRAFLLLSLAGVVAVAVALAVLWPRCSGAACPSVLALRTYAPPQASTVYDGAGRVVAHLAPERRVVVPLERIPAHVSGAFLAVEDKRFYRHAGIDWRRLAGALYHDVRTLRYDQGFSTVTMQLARNVFPEHLSRAKTLRRKLWEVMLARRIEQSFSKDEILEMYLNQIYLGEGLYGVEAAARGYFGKPAGSLTAAEAAMLAALPKAPSYYTPRRNPVAAVGRRNLVLGRMAQAGVVSRAEADEAAAQPVRLVPPAEAKGAAPYFVAAVRRELRERFGPEADNEGLKVFTTLDPALQAAAERELVRQVRAVEGGRFGRFRGASCADGTPEDASRCLQGLFVAMDARSGDVLALVGGRDYGMSQFDRVTQAKRQAGSAFKPIVYAAAIDAGIPVSTPVIGPGSEGWEQGDYRPADHVADSLTVDMREGLRLSSNRAAVSVGERAGAGRVVDLAKQLGLTTPIKPYPSTFLGAADVVPLEMVAAYTAFAAGGQLARPRLIRRVEDAAGNVLYTAEVSRRQVLAPGVAFLTTSLMRDVVDRGTGAPVRTAGGLPYEVPAAGKTGTTNEGADVWFIGATPDVVAGVWLGFDRPRAILGNASGGELAAPVWGRVLAAYYQRHPVPAPWSAPADLETHEIDRATGQLATPACPGGDVRTEWFVPGTAPLAHCALHPDDGSGWFGRTLDGLGDLFGGDEKEQRAREKVPPPPAPLP